MAMLDKNEKLETKQESISDKSLSESLVTFLEGVCTSFNESIGDDNPFFVSDSDGKVVVSYIDRYGLVTDFGKISLRDYDDYRDALRDILKSIESYAADANVWIYEKDIEHFIRKKAGDKAESFFYDDIERHETACLAVDRFIDFCIKAKDEACKLGYISKKENDEGFEEE